MAVYCYAIRINHTLSKALAVLKPLAGNPRSYGRLSPRDKDGVAEKKGPTEYYCCVQDKIAGRVNVPLYHTNFEDVNNRIGQMFNSPPRTTAYTII